MNKRVLLVVAIAVLIIGYFGWLGMLGLRAEEPRRAIVSIEMMEHADYIPSLLGWTYYNKPPLFNWVMIAFFKVFQSTSEWIVRLPSLLSLFLMAFLTWKIGKKHLGNDIATLSALFLLTSADILVYGGVNTGEIDLFFSLLVFLNLLAIYHYLNVGEFGKLFIVSYFIAALGFLTKGLPALSFQALTLVSAVFFFKKFRMLFHWKHAAGILLFLLVSGAYVYLLYLRGEHMGFIVRQFKEASQRTGLDSNAWNTLLGIVNSPLILLKILLPWSLAGTVLFLKPVRKTFRQNRFALFSLLILAVNFPLYWITGELRARYIYPLVPFACIVLANAYHAGVSSSLRISRISDWFIKFMILVIPTLHLVALFLPLLKMNSVTISITAGMMALSVLGIVTTFRVRHLRIFLLVLLIGFARITINAIYIPLYKSESETTHLKRELNTVLEKIHYHDLEVIGSPHVYDSRLKFFGKEFLKYEAVVPPVISYQFPYYYYRVTGKTLNYNPNPVPGRYYMVKDVNRGAYAGTDVYTFRDPSIRHHWIVIHYP